MLRGGGGGEGIDRLVRRWGMNDISKKLGAHPGLLLTFEISRFSQGYPVDSLSPGRSHGVRG
jgi:hypothetical protein